MPKIEDYALLGDLHTAALVSTAGSIDWLCLPRFDSPAAFAALLHNEQAGHWTLAPLADSRVTLRPDGAIKLALQPGNNTEGLTRLRKTFQGMLGKLGMVETTFVRSLYLHKAFDEAATAHQAGTVRFGTDPAASVLDVHCRAHDLDNLYVVDGSFMPSIGAVNPTLTIIANALRVGDHIAERLGTTP